MLIAPATCTAEMPTKPRPSQFLTVTQPSHTRTAKLTTNDTMLKQRKRPITTGNLPAQLSVSHSENQSNAVKCRQQKLNNGL